MKKRAIAKVTSTIILMLIFSAKFSFSQSANDVLNLLISNRFVTQQQADSLRAEAAVKQQEVDARRKSFPLNISRLFQLSGYTQIRYQQVEEKGKTSGFDIRRARLDLKGSVTPYFAYRVQTEFLSNPKLLDAYAEIRIADYFTLTAGQFKIPLSLENLTASNKLEMIDRSQAVEALVARGKDILGNTNGRDIGIQASGSLIKIKGAPFFEYRIGIFNGSGINIADTANSNKDISGRFLINPVKGLSVGGAFYSGFDKVSKPDLAGQSQTRDRIGFEASYVLTRLSFRAEYLSGKDGKTSRSGWYVQAGYFLIPQKIQVLGRYDTYDPNTSKTGNVTTNYTFGGNINFNSWARLQIFYTIRAEEGPSVSNNYLSAQFQIGF